MPFYEYQCKSCGHDLEAMQKISEPPLRKCPHCGKAQLQRLMSAPVFRLKGGGWYETDFKGDSDNKKNLADRPDADAPKDSGKDGAKDAATAGADAKAGDGKASDAKTAEGGSAKDAPAGKDKAAEKPAEKAAAGPTKKLDLSKGSASHAKASRGRTTAKRPVKRAAPKAKRGR